MILVEIINFDCTEEPQESLAWVLVVWVSAVHLKEAVHVALVHNPEHFLINPLEARRDKLCRLVLVKEFPVDAEHVRRNIHVDMPRLRLDDREVFVAEVYVELVCEVGREKHGHTHLLSEARVPRNPELFFPLDLLAFVLFIVAQSLPKHVLSFRD